MTSPTRKGHPCTYNMDRDALVLLRELVPSQRAYGKFLSELIRREACLREERARIRAALAAVLEPVRQPE
jgi:hypothetical protein